MRASFSKYILNFKLPSGTSRGVLKTKETYFLKLGENNSFGIGECALFRGLSYDDVPEYEEKLKWLCDNINLPEQELFNNLIDFPSIQFGLEQALLSFKSKNPLEIFPSKFTKSEDSISINGLIWMGDKDFMKRQIEDKLEEGFSTIKIKIGAINFNTELGLLKTLRNNYSAGKITIRVDANGAFSVNEALEKLKILSQFDIHSIEQPIRHGHLVEMAELCEKTPIPIALDEELIGVNNVTKKEKLLQIINPQFIILKPSLVGGFKGSEEWIDLAKKQDIGWWITSALESNIGLNAISQWTYILDNKLPQGLGTGSLFTNNIESPLEVKKGHLHYCKLKDWKLNNTL